MGANPLARLDSRWMNRNSERLRLASPCARALLFVCAAVSLSCATSPTVDFGSSEACYPSVAQKLSADEMEGRGIGTRGLRNAGTFLSRSFAALNLEPVRTGSVLASYRQPFRAVVGVKAGGANQLGFRTSTSAEFETAEFKVDFRPFGFSATSRFEGGLVFAGYGIKAEPLGYDDYAGIDVKDKVVLVMRYEPGESDPESPFDGKRPSRFSDLRYKALKAREAGASALIFTSPPGEEDEEDRLPRMVRSGPLSDAGIPVLQIKRDLATKLLALAGEDLKALHAVIEADVKPHSRVLSNIEIMGSTEVVTRHTELENIVGVFPGSGALADEAVVVGAHFDHLGHGGSSSLNPDDRQIHNGADDNASGVAAMVCGVAQAVERTKSSNTSRRRLIVIGFSGEESGLLGSAWYVRNPPFPIEDTMAMVNLDMVGRLREQKLHAMGTDSSPGWRPILEPLATRHGIDLSAGGDGYGPSDHMSFYGEDVPVTHFFTGSHPEYHTAKDDYALLNIAGGVKVSNYLSDVLDTLLHQTEPLSYQASTTGSTMAGDARGFGAYLGSIPDYAEMMNREGGVLLSGVRKEGPADRAGIMAEDRIVGMDGVEIHNLHDMTFVLRDHRPGDVIEVEFLRDDKPEVAIVTLGKRGERTTPQSSHGAKDPHATTD